MVVMHGDGYDDGDGYWWYLGFDDDDDCNGCNDDAVTLMIMVIYNDV